MNTKSLFSVLVIVVIVGSCKKKAKKRALYPDLCHGKKLICIENAKNENLRKYGTPKIEYLVPYFLQNTKNRAIFQINFFPLRECFFFNFGGTALCDNKYDKGILNIRPLLCKSIDILLRSVLS